MPGRGSKRRPYAPRMPAEERRQQLLDATLRIVVERGHHKVTMETVAVEAGVTKPVVYGVFHSRGELLAALLEREQQGAVEQVMSAFTDGRLDLARTPPDELIAGITRAYLEGVREEEYRWRCILFAVEGAPRELRAAVAESRELLRVMLAGVLESFVATQSAAPAVDIDIASHSLVAFAERAGQLVLDQPETYTVDRFVRASKVLLRLLQP